MNSRRLRIAFVSPWPVSESASWSGMIAPMYRHLGARADVVAVYTGGVRPVVLDRAIMRFVDGWRGQHILPDHTILTARKRAKSLARTLGGVHPDVLLDVVASTDFAFLHSPWPVVHVSDATFAAIDGYYPVFSDLLRVSHWQAEGMARRVTRPADYYAAATDWASASLRDDYAIGPEHIKVCPFGPGIDPPAQLHRSLVQGGSLRALLVSSNWERKGGDTAIAAIEAGRDLGISVTLTVVGDAPELPAFATALGCVSRDGMAEIYLTHDVLLEPTRANAAGVTLTDAAAFGLPCIASATGGVATIVEDSRTGVLVPLTTSSVRSLLHSLPCRTPPSGRKWGQQHGASMRLS